MITYDIHVLMGASANEINTTVKCHDTGVNLRVFPETLTKLSARRFTTEPYTIPSGSVAVLKVVKSDRTHVLTDAKQVDQNSVFFELPPQTFTAAGKALAEMNIFAPDGRRITSGTFIIDVSRECVDDSSEESKGYVDVMASQIKVAMDAASRAEEAAKQAMAGGATDEQLEKAVKAYFEKNPVGIKPVTYATLFADKWVWNEHEGYYEQVVKVDGVKENSVLSLAFSAAQLAVLQPKAVTFVAKNKNCVVTVCAVCKFEDKPQNDYEIQITVEGVKI